MAKLYVTELKSLVMSDQGAVQVGKWPPEASQVVVIGGGSLSSAAFQGTTQFLRLESDVVCSFEVGANPTATANSARMAADSPEYIAVNPGDKIAVITNT